MKDKKQEKYLFGVWTRSNKKTKEVQGKKDQRRCSSQTQSNSIKLNLTQEYSKKLKESWGLSLSSLSLSK